MTTEITKPTVTQLDEVLNKYRGMVTDHCDHGPCSPKPPCSISSCIIMLAMTELFDEVMPNRKGRGGMNAGDWFISMIPKWIMEGKVEMDDPDFQGHSSIRAAVEPFDLFNAHIEECRCWKCTRPDIVKHMLDGSMEH